MSKNIHKILLPVDFKEASVKALLYASAYAANNKVLLILHNVIVTPGLLTQFFKSNELNQSQISVLSHTTLPVSQNYSSFFSTLIDPLGVLIKNKT